MERVELRPHAPARVLGYLDRDVGQLVLIRIERGHRIRRYRVRDRAERRPRGTALSNYCPLHSDGRKGHPPRRSTLEVHR